MSRTTCTREHTISCGHRVHNHESKCANFHGHNYTIQITCSPFDQLDSVGRVVDFSVIKSICCEWLEREWDHKFLMWTEDPWYQYLGHVLTEAGLMSVPGIVGVDFNPTAENMARWLLQQFNHLLLDAHQQVECTYVRVIETPKCWADYEVEPFNNILRK